MRTHLKNLGQREFHPVTGATQKVKQPRLRGQKLPPGSGSERRQARTRSLGQGGAVGPSTGAGATASDAGGGGCRLHRLITLPFELPPPLAPGLKATRPEHMGTWEGVPCCPPREKGAKWVLGHSPFAACQAELMAGSRLARPCSRSSVGVSFLSLQEAPGFVRAPGFPL